MVNGTVTWHEYARNGFVLSRRLFRTRSQRLVRLRKQLLFADSGAQGKSFSVGVERRTGANCHVRQMEQYLTRHLASDILGVYVHGSLGTNEVVPYSDFDALVILRSQVFTEVARLVNAALYLCRAQRIMREFDPLQHHGWFVIDEAMLERFPEHYFPAVLFEHAKALDIPQNTNELHVCIDVSRRKFIEVFDNLVAGLAADTASRRFQMNTYFLKSTLSKLLLLPAVYVQARDGKGVFKRDSFELARRDFADRDWSIIRIASQLRREWAVNMSPILRKLMIQPSWWGKIVQRHLAPPLTDRMRSLLGVNISADVCNLVDKMCERLLPLRGVNLETSIGGIAQSRQYYRDRAQV